MLYLVYAISICICGAHTSIYAIIFLFYVLSGAWQKNWQAGAEAGRGRQEEGAGRRKGQGQGNRTLAHPFAMADDNNHFECLPHFQRTQLGCVCVSLSVCVCVHDYLLFREQMH